MAIFPCYTIHPVAYFTYNSWCAVLSHFSHVRLFATLWTISHQPPLSMRFSRQGYWSGLPCPPPGDPPNPGIEPESLCLLNWQVGSFTTSATWEAPISWYRWLFYYQAFITYKITCNGLNIFINCKERNYININNANINKISSCIKIWKEYLDRAKLGSYGLKKQM